MTTYTSQPDDTTGFDCRIIDSSPTTAFDDVNLGLGESNTGAQIQRSLWKDAFTGIPTTAVVDSATLSLYISSADEADANTTVSAYRVLRSWSEGATWNRYSPGNDWGTAGCSNTTTDREAASIGSVLFTNGAALGTEFQIALTASKVQEWISGATANYGILLKAGTENNDLYYAGASGNGTAARRVKIVVVYHLPTPSVIWI